MKALCNHYEGEAELDVQASKAQQILDTLVYTNEKQMTFEAMITKIEQGLQCPKEARAGIHREEQGRTACQED